MTRSGLYRQMRSTRAFAVRVPLKTPAADRWADSILSGIAATADPRTIQDWSRLANAAPATLRNRCTAAGVPAKASLDFLRLLRAVVQGKEFGYPPAALLDGDARTVRRLLAAGGLASDDGRTCDVAAFVNGQLIIRNAVALASIRARIAAKGSC
jgi:hypothetical protein